MSFLFYYLYMGDKMIGIYKIENLINGHIYIGQSISIERRLKEHLYKPFYEKSDQYNTPLYRAIRKYGKETFSFEIIEECSKDLLNEREIYWIDYYHSYIGDGQGGYNLTRGGEGSFSIIHDRILDLWDEGKNIGNIAEKLEISKVSVINHLIGYKNYSPEESKIRGYNSLKKIIKMYDLGFNLIKTFPSADAAAKEIGVTTDTIKNCCSHRTNTCKQKYIFCFEDEEPKDFFKSKRVAQYDLNFNLINIFLTVRQAAQETHHSEKKIGDCCKKIIPSYVGYYWKYI